MKTIEERADEFVGHSIEIGEDLSIAMSRNAYIQGAKEQRQIYIEKALDWLNCYYFSRKSLIAEEFKKYMEEE